MENLNSYALFFKQEILRDYTNLALYYQNIKKKEKTSGPIDIEGIRYKLDYETGELRLYKQSEYKEHDRVSIIRSKKLLTLLLEMNDFDWFCTLTFDNLRIKRSDDKAIYKAYEKFIHNIHQQFPTLRYITVLERHEDGNIHFHLLIGGVPWQKLGFVNSGKVCCHWATKKNGICSKEYYEKTKHLHELKDTDGLTVYNITSFIYGFTTATRIASREKCNSYIKKYLDKAFGSTEAFKKRFYYSSNLNTPEIVKQCIGADFWEPTNTELFAKENLLFDNADKKTYMEKFNISFARISNDKKINIERGLIPTEDETLFD